MHYTATFINISRFYILNVKMLIAESTAGYQLIIGYPLNRYYPLYILIQWLNFSTWYRG